MNESNLDPAAGASAPVPSGLLTPALRRDLADLNEEYLELGLTPGLDADPRFAWSAPVRCCLQQADLETRARLAAVPFALFDLVLPVAGHALPPDRVEDCRPAGRLPGCQWRIDSFSHQAVFLARRLVDREPLAPRLVLGLADEVQKWLAARRLQQLAETATSPGLIQPRWRRHLRFWEMLVGAARRSSPGAMQWAHCVGLCLIGASDGDVAEPPPRRRPRR